MKKLLVGLMLSTVSLFAAAQISSQSLEQAGFNKLSETQKAEIVAHIAKNNEQKTDLADAKQLEVKAEKWVDLGERMGKMLGGAAKEVGVAVNDFVKTPVGQLTMLLIVWSYVGNALVHIFGGVFIIIVGLLMCMYWARRSINVSTEYDQEKVDIFGRARVRHVKREALSSDAITGFTISSLAIMGVGLIVMFTF